MNKRLHKGPSASAILASRREKVKPAELRRIGQALEHREARLRSGWDCYHTVRAVISGPDDLRQWTNVPDGAIEAARHGDVSRLLDCLRAHKPFEVGDRDRLAAYIAMKKRRRLWSPELVRALNCPPTDDDYDLLADVVAEVGRKRGRVFDAPWARIAQTFPAARRPGAAVAVRCRAARGCAHAAALAAGRLRAGSSSSTRSTAACSTGCNTATRARARSDRCALPAMSDGYIDQCCREIARVLRPSGYLLLWADTFRLCTGAHLRIADILPCVDLIAWDNLRPGNGYRTRRRGDYLLVLQKPPLRAKATWRDHGIPDRWAEKVDRRIHPHAKPAGLIARLIGAVTAAG